MATEQIFISPVISFDKPFPDSTNHFLDSFKGKIEPDINNGMNLDFKVYGRKGNQKIIPLLKKAVPDDAKEIVNIYKDIYDGTYPYKEMEDEDEVRKMIKSSEVEWIVFKNKDDEIIGCFTFMLNFEDKMGYLRGLNVKKKYLGKIDILKAAMGSFLAMYSTYEHYIYRWYGESRTAHTKSQYALGAGGFKPIAFYPNKDVFYNKIESDILLICYDERALRQYRCKTIPKIIPAVYDCFLYSDKKYNLGSVQIKNPNIRLNQIKVVKIQNETIRKLIKDEFGYIKVKFLIKNSDSYFEFLYTPLVNNFEKIKYRVKNLEELFVFVKELKKCAREFGVRYYEAYISAYKTKHQKIFYDAGLSPRGYIPSWKYDKLNDCFEDFILFNCFEGELDKEIRLLEEGKELLNYLNFNLD